MAAESIKEALDARGLLAHVVLPPHIDELLDALISPDNVAIGADVEGTVALGVRKSLGFLALDLTPQLVPVKFRLITNAAAHSFRFWMVLNSAAGASRVFEFAAGTAGVALTPAKHPDGDEDSLVATDGEVSISGAAVALLIEGAPGTPATIRLSPTVGAPAGIVELQLNPPTVLIGGTSFGFELPTTNGIPGAFVIDDSSEAAPSGHTVINGTTITTRADTPAWRGIAVRNMRFYLPPGTPYLGGHPVSAYLEVGMAPGEGIDLAIATRVPAEGSRPAIDVLIECRDPTATGMQDFIPTLVEAVMELPLDGNTQPSPGGGFTMVAGKPVIARLRFARSVADPDTRLSLAVESQGPSGVVDIVTPGGGPAARVVITAGALATALVADEAPAGADTGGVVLHALLAAALGLSSCLKDKGRLTIHRVELSSTGHGLPVGDSVKLLIDYSVDVLVRPINVGLLSVELRDEQPMRVRNRNVGLRINLSNPAASGVETVELDFRRADMEIEDPGSWKVSSPASLFDILGTRSGRGSSWLEVDLRFKLNLGPVRVSGATIRATLTGNGNIEATLRGLDASLAVPGVIDGRGALQLLEGGGFAAALDVSLLPLKLATDGQVVYEEKSGSFWLFVQIGVDLPGAIPIANTGLGIYGIAGAFGYNARPKPPSPTEPDPIGYQLRWDPSKPLEEFTFSADNVTVGAQAVLGTVPDLGFTFSTRAGLFITVPDIVVRGALWAKVLSPRMSVTDRPSEGGDPGLSFMGVVVVDPADAVTIGLKGELNIPILLELEAPLGARFPVGVKAHEWFIHLGTDGYEGQGRGSGPIRATVLPDLIGAYADAYVMLRGNGIERWPRGGPINISDGLVIAFGFGFEYPLGVKPVAWADIHASADVLVATRPLTLAGFGTAGGSLHLGPFSIGVDAMLSVLVVENAKPFVHARLCGHIDLFFTEIEGCVEMSINTEPEMKVPPPDVHPLDDIVDGQVAGHLAYLIDDRYRRIHTLPTNREAAPTVWPDTLLHLSFAISPRLAPGYVATVGAGPQFSSIGTYPVGLAATPVGSDMLRYDWSLTGLALYDVTEPQGPAALVAGPLSAAWQAGKDGDLGRRPQAGDLVLLTYHGHLFLNRLSDHGTGLPHDPLQAAANACLQQVDAVAGWAVGFIATATGLAFVLPSDPISPDPCVSRFTATVTQYTDALPFVPLGVGSAALLPPPFDFQPASVDSYASPVNPERPFSGALVLGVTNRPYIRGLAFDRRFQWQWAFIVPDQPLMSVPDEPPMSVRLWVIADAGPEGEPLAAVFDNLGHLWAVTQKADWPDGRRAFRFAPRDEGWIGWVAVRWALGRPLAILGLGGVTATAQAAAAARNAAVRAEADRQKNAAAAQPQQEHATTGEGVRAILQPGRTYRLDVAMTWDGVMYRQNEDGTKVIAGQVFGQTQYEPRGAAVPTSRSYYFKTVPKAIATGGIGGTQLSAYYSASYLQDLYVRRDFFDPKMLTRFLLGYTPGQTETARFCDDPLNVHFSAAHVISLAKVYGYTLKIGLRRVDAPGADGEPVELNPLWVAMSEPAFLTGLDAHQYEVATTAACAIPKPGATLTAQAPLVPEAWYEIYALAKSDSSSVADGRLDGVSFRTSRWRTPLEMLGGIGFLAEPGQAAGDVELATLPAFAAGEVDGSDADFEAALDAIGMDGWPPSTNPRVSVLWQRQSAEPAQWFCAGLLVESPEPIARRNRVELIGLRLVMPPVPPGIFDIRRTDHTQSRMLWLCSTPFQPQSWVRQLPFARPRRILPSIALELKDVSTGATLTGSVALPLSPSFAEEA
jgi:hypothetical protein